jgi:TrmH family RNA methyltransferase
MKDSGEERHEGGGDDHRRQDGDFDLSGFAGGEGAPRPDRKAGKGPGDKAPGGKGPRGPGRPGAGGPKGGRFERPGFAGRERAGYGPRGDGPRSGNGGPRSGGYGSREGGPRGGSFGPREGGARGGFGPRGESGPRSGNFRKPFEPRGGDRAEGRSWAPRGERPDGPPRRFAPKPGGPGAPGIGSGPAAAPAFKPVSPEIKPYLSLKQDKGRWKESRFLLEGAKNVADALAISPSIFHAVFVVPEFKDKALLAAVKKNRIALIPVSEDDILALSETETPQGVVAVCNFATLRPDWNLARYVTLMDAVQDPGNVGAIFRTSAALGMDAVVLGKGSCDPYNPKVVRSSVGALLGMPFETGEDLGSKIAFLRQKGFSVVATSSHAKETLEQAKLRKKVALIVGNEGAGTGASYQDMADAVVKIPLKSKVESLNVAVAHGILSYQLIHGRQ